MNCVVACASIDYIQAISVRYPSASDSAAVGIGVGGSLDIRRFDLDVEGLERVLGELEARILEVVWETGPTTVKAVTEVLGSEAHVKTTMTVINRMVEKGLLRRKRHGRAFIYTAVTDRETFMMSVATRVIDGLIRDFGRPALAHLVDSADPQQLAELEAMIRSRRDA